MIKNKRFARPPHAPRMAAVLVLAALGAGVALTSGCTLDPPGPSPIYSRLPANQADALQNAPVLTPDERQRYDAIDRQALAESNQAAAADAAAQAWSRAYAPPVTVFGSYYSGGGGWGGGWGTGIGYGYPGWGW
ncbi:hypothetical protein [Paraburkholderia unamae]|uniref:Lipoprotein n=1 Tax=Paraburkholderia unamae TaxID=219649 RepID=A0ABX5KRK8_9BURK|nr:hypothetical protein C7402_107330 [Paraburkholderia unamae]RAR60114.1 hypothetical protein C7401_110251 [Paraburkholderia unamae]